MAVLADSSVMFLRLILCLFFYFYPDRRQRHHPGDRAAQGPGPGPAQAHAHLLHGRAAVPARARVPAVPVRGGPGAHGARPPAQPVRDAGRTSSQPGRKHFHSI